MKHFFLILACWFGFQTHSSAKSLDIKKYDKNKDGLLSVDEREVYLIHCSREVFEKYDANVDGILSPEEAAGIANDENKAAAKLVRNRAVEIRNFEKDEGEMLPADVSPILFREAAGIEEEKKVFVPKHLRLRATVEDFAVPVDPQNPLSKINPLILSYTYNAINDGDQWAAKGAIGGFWGGKKSFAKTSLGAQFERLSADEPGVNDVNVLIFKALLSDRVFLDGPVVKTIGWNAGLTYASNFDFDGGQLGGTADIVPLWSLKPFTGVWSVFGVRSNFSARNRPALSLSNSLHVEGGGTVSAPSGQALPDDKYFRVGPRLEGSLWPLGYHSHLRLFSNYTYYFETLGSGPDYHDFGGGLEWQLDSDGHWLFNATYTHGLAPMSLQRREVVLLSLGVRF